MRYVVFVVVFAIVAVLLWPTIQRGWKGMRKVEEKLEPPPEDKV